MKRGRVLLPLLLLAIVVACAGGTDLTGKWVVEKALPASEGPAGEKPPGPPGGGPLMDAVLDLSQDGTTLAGALGTHMFDQPLSDGTVEGDTFSFVLKMEIGTQKMEIPFSGKAVDDTIELTVQPPGGMPPMTLVLRRASD